jgi:hypothetical protein
MLINLTEEIKNVVREAILLGKQYSIRTTDTPCPITEA